MNTKIIGNNIRAHRKNLNLSQEDLASYLGIKREMLSYYENGTRKIGMGNVKKVADFFGLEPIDFMENDLDLQVVNVALGVSSTQLKSNYQDILITFREIVKTYINLAKLNEK